VLLFIEFIRYFCYAFSTLASTMLPYPTLSEAIRQAANKLYQ